MKAALERLDRAAWVLQYRLELARDRHAAHQRYVAEIGCCIALIVARIVIGGPR
ncbi:MAG: hypothetical protein OJF60_003405 [Burkholderiaceae bacterium]|jgi:hypothetical protein|nr:MAG: hypothetical protein OJF60_003405 [Burkholderiaceae bacterium]